MPGKFTQHVTQATLQNRFDRRSAVIGAVQGGDGFFAALLRRS